MILPFLASHVFPPSGCRYATGSVTFWPKRGDRRQILWPPSRRVRRSIVRASDMNREAPLPFVLRRCAAAGLVGLFALAPAALSAAPARAAYSSGGSEKVAAQDDYFDAEAVHVAVGTSVEWDNTGRNPHTVTADDGSRDSGNLSPGKTFTI